MFVLLIGAWAEILVLLIGARAKILFSSPTGQVGLLDFKDKAAAHIM